MRVLRPVVLLASVTLAACASVREADVRLPGAYEAPAPAGKVELDRWWVNFDDPDLTSLIEQTLAANTDIRSAEARLREARATRDRSLLGFLPQGSATGSARRTDTEQISGTVVNIPGFSNSGVSEAYAADFNVSWEIDLFGRFFAARKVAQGEVAAAAFNYEATRASLAAQTADAYFAARGLAIQLADARETIRIQQGLYEVAFKRGERGLAATSEADRVSGDLAQARAQAAALEALLQVQRRALLILAGRIVEPTANLADATPPSVGTIPAVPAAVPGELLERRPDVREARARVRSAAGQLLAAKLAFLPTLNFTPGVGYSRTIQPGFESETRSWSIGGNITQPVLNIPSLIADVRAQGARAEQAVLAYEKSIQTAFAESEGALVQLDADRRRVALLTDGEARAQRAYRAARIGYDRGFNDLQTTLAAEQAWRATRGQLTAAQVEGLRRAVQAYKALGGGWSAPGVPSQSSVSPRPVETP